MRRFAEEHLDAWLQKPNRKPLVIRGARQVGKSTLVRQFAAARGMTLNEINLERHLALDAVFQTLDTQRIARELGGLIGRDVLAPGGLLFLDEIQATPWALQALRYFREDHAGLPVVAAGSLLEFVLARHSFSMPVGRIEYLHLGPMTFEEFLLEVRPDLLNYVRESGPGDPCPETAHRRLLDRQREFLLVGGMPEAVSAFVQTGSFVDVADVQRSIVATYQDDFAKYASQSALVRLQRVFSTVPRTVGRKVKYSHYARDETAREVKTAMDLLSKARVIAPVIHSHATGVPLEAEADEFTYKLLFLDVGLMNRICGLDWLAVSSLDDRALVNEGSMAEQFIGQHLLYLGGAREQPRAHYWLRQRKSANAEVDYVVSRGRHVVPVEVKAGKSGTLRSVLQFVLEKRVDVAVRFDLNPPSRQRVCHHLRHADGTERVECTLISLPLYLVDQLARIIDMVRGSGPAP